MANQYINAMTAIWNSVGTTYSGIKMNVTADASSGINSPRTPINLMSKLLHLQAGTIDKFTVDKFGNVVAAGDITAAGLTTSAAMVPLANDGAALGSSAASWSDLYLASGGIINWNAGDVTMTHSANLLAHAGAGLGYTFDAAVLPSTNDAAALGASGTAWGDLFLATGGVINWNAGDVTITHVLSPNRLDHAGAAAGYTFDAAVLPSVNDIAALGASGQAWADLYLASGSVINWSASDLTLTHSSDTLTLAGGNLTLAGGNLTLSGALSGTTGTFSGTVSGASGSFSADLTATTGSFSAGISATTGTFSSAITATTGSFSGAAAASSLTTSGNIQSTGGNVYASSILGVAGTTGNCHLWFYGPNSEDRAVIYTAGGSYGALNFRVNGGATMTLDSGGSLYVPGALTAISTITTNQPIFANGYRCKTGIYGGYGGNTYNWYWGNGYLDVYIDATPFRIITPSDYRLKKDVADLPSTWAKVKALRPVSYLPSGYVMPTGVEATELPEGAAKEEAPGSTFSTDDGEQWSLVAHEVQEALIHSAAHGEKDIVNGLQTLNLNAIVAALTKALQEAMARIEVLEAKVGA